MIAEPVHVAGLATAVIPVYNRPGQLVAAVDAALAQTYRPLEIIVVDDGSTDGTSAACERLEQEHPGEVRFVRRRNGGPGAARESGRQAARGEFIQYLDSDDWIDPRKLEIQIAALLQDPDADIAYCRALESHTARPGVTAIRGRTGERLDSIFPHLLSGRIWPTHSPLYRRSFSDRLGPWTDLRQEEDLEYEARAGAFGARLVYCPETLAVQRHHEGERAGGGSDKDISRMRCRYESHRLVFAHARAAGVDPADPNMQKYARELFLLARQCGVAGMTGESKQLFQLARDASGPSRGRGLDFAVYATIARSLGWERAGRIAQRFDSLRAFRRGRAA